MKIFVCGTGYPQTWILKISFSHYYHLLEGELLPFSHCCVCSVLQPSAYTGEDAEPIQISKSADNSGFTNRIICIPLGEKRKKLFILLDKQAFYLSFIPCINESARCHSSVSGPLPFFPRAGPHLQNPDPNWYKLTCLLPLRPPSSCSTALAPFYLFVSILKCPVPMQLHCTSSSLFLSLCHYMIKDVDLL